MEPTAPSFIPHDATAAGGVRRRSGRGLLDLISLISLVLFIASGALGAGVFLYIQYLQSSATSKVDQLERAQAAFEPALIQELTRLDDRMHVASDIVGRHLAPSAFFKMLERTTLQTISFRSLTFDAADSQHISIRMDGIAESVNSIALQADLFSKVGIVTSPIFSNIDRRLDGVHFSLSASLNPSALNYTSLVREAAQEASTSATPAGGEGSPELPASPFDAPGEGEGALPEPPTGSLPPPPAE